MTAAPASRLVLPVTFVIWVAYGILAGFGRWPLATLWIAVALPLVSMGAASAFTSIYRRRLRARG